MIFHGLTGGIIQAAMKVHTALGAGLFEEVYKICSRHELDKQGIKVLAEVGLPVTYHRAQLLTYLKLADLQVRLVINFNVQHLKNGILRVVNSYPTPCPPCTPR